MPPSAFVSWPADPPWAEAVVLGFAFVWGAMLGSFLNVVAHRLPRGESVVRGRSRCPRCGAAVRARDNLPVLGWILLRGRCRDCRAAIAPGYPLVEAGCGLLLAATAGLDLVPDVDRMLVHGAWLPVVRFAFHAGVLLTAVAWGMLAMAGARVRRPTIAVAVAVVGLAVVALPGLQPLGLLPAGGPWPPERPRLAALLSWLVGTAVGGAGTPCLPVVAHAPLMLLAAAFGWQTVTAAGVLAIVARAAGRRLRPARRTDEERRKSSTADGMMSEPEQ